MESPPKAVAEMTAPARELARRLSLGDSIAIVVGVMIGGGIFLVPNLVARALPSVPLILGVWVLAGAISLIGALACAELGAAFPSTGGLYVFLREAYGPLAAFLCGWSSFTVTRGAQSAWSAVVFSMYASYLVPMGPLASKLLSLTVLAIFTWVNYRGAKLGAIIMNSFTLAKVVGALVIIVAALALGGHTGQPAAPAASRASLSSFGVALIACLLAYDGWVQLSFVAGEIRDPQRNVVRALTIGTLGVTARALTIGTLGVTAIYLLANIAYLHVLTVAEIAASDHVGATVVSVIILLSILGTLNGCCLTIPRVYFAQAADGLFFRRFADVHPRYGTPAFAIVAQSVWAAVLLVTGSYEALIDYALFGIWVFYALMVAGVMVLRRRRADLPRPYRMWGYPVTPLVFLAITLWFLGNMLVTRPGPALAGLGLILTGIPAYLIWKRCAHPQSAGVWK